MAFTDWSSTPILNADVPGISWHDRPQNTMVVATSARQMMADLVTASAGWGGSGGSGTVTSISAGYGMTFATITVSGAVAVDPTVIATLATAQVLTNKTISGASNTFSNIPISALTGGPLTVPFGGIGVATLAAGYAKSNGTSAFTSVTTIPQADVTGLTTSLAGKADTTITITGATSLTGGGDLSANRTISLVNDSATPGATRYYGTDSGGVKGYFTFPASAATAWGTITGTLSAQTDLQTALDAKADETITITGATSLTGGGDLTANRTIALVNDASAPGALYYYGTDPSGVKGYWTFPAAGAVTWGSISGTLSAQSDLQTALNLKADLASPTLTGVPAAPTAAGGTNTTQLATTAFVQTAVSGLGVGTVTSVTNTGGGLTITGGSGPVVNIDIAAPIAPALGGTGLLIPLYVDAIADMTAFTTSQLVDGQTINVLGYTARDDGGGGMFYWDSASTTTTDLGTSFQSASGGVGRWLRFNDTDIVNVLWWDAGSGAADVSTEAQAAYDYAHSGSINKRLYFPSSYYNLSINLTSQYVGIFGAGISNVQLRPPTATGTVFSITDTSGAQTPLVISDLSINGVGTKQGIGIEHTSAGPGGGSSGRELVQRVQFNNLDTAVSRMYGDFTAWYYDNTFELTNYHFYSESASYAHAGDIIVRNGGMLQANLACFYFDSTLGQSGKIIIEAVTIQNNPGYVLFVKNMNVGSTGVPAPVIRDCWNEGNALGGSITVGGVTGTPVWGYFKNDPGYVGLWLIQNMAPGPMTLINFNVRTTDCDLTYTVGTTFDAESTLVHDAARWINYQNIIGFVNSVSYIDKGSGTAAAVGSWYQTHPMTVVMKVPGATNKLRSDGSANITYTKSGGGTVATANATDNGIATLATCQDLTITGTDTWDSPNTGAGTVSTGYLCWTWVGKLISGTAPTLRCGISTGAHISLYRTIDETEFVTLKGMVPLDASVSFYGFEYSSTGNCVVREAGWSIDHFTDLNQAMNYLNSGVFPA